MRKFILNLQFVFKPSYWLMNNRHSKEVDKLMNHLLDNFEFTDIKSCTAKLGDVTIWIENQPYSCMYPYIHGKIQFSRPSRLTIKKGIDKLNKSMMEEHLKKISDTYHKAESK